MNEKPSQSRRWRVSPIGGGPKWQGARKETREEIDKVKSGD